MQTPPRVVQGAAGYLVRLTLEQQRDFPNTPHVFVATVQKVLPTRHVVNEYIELVYSPLLVRVDKVIRGSATASGTRIIRALGGIAEGVEFRSEMTPSPAILRRGAKLLIFGAEPVKVLGDGEMLAMTPNGIFLVEGDTVVDATFASPHAGGSTARLL